MRWKSILLYGLGLFLLLFGNSDLWEKLKAENIAKRKQLDSLRANEDATSKFEIQKVFYDSISGKWLDQPPTYHAVHIKKQKKIIRKKKVEKKIETHVETNQQPENASDTH